VFVGICIEETTHWKLTIGIWRLKTFKKKLHLKISDIAFWRNFASKEKADPISSF
jgi:hypothetical protein